MQSIRIGSGPFPARRTVCAAVLAALVWHSARAQASFAEESIVFFDAHVFTAEPAAPFAEAVAIRGGKIVAVGERSAVMAAAGPTARQIDLKGKFLMPGMVDAHAHPIDGGLTLIQAHYPDPRDSIPDLAQFVAGQLRAKSSRVGDVLVVYDLDLGFWPHAAEMDAVLSAGEFAHAPVVLYGSDGHTAWANRPARRRAGITAKYLRSLPPEERHYYGFENGFEPTGFVVDAGKSKLNLALPPLSSQTMLTAGRAAVKYMNALGITGWLDAAAAGVVGGSIPASARSPGVLPVYGELGRRGELTAHVAAYPVIKPSLGSPQIDVVQALQAQFKDIPNLRMPGLKIFADGVVEIPSQTAALTKPYVNSGKSTPPLFTPEGLNALVTEADRRGLMVHVHAIGDLAVKQSLDAFAAARRANPAAERPFTLTHAQFVDPEDVPRFAQLRVIAALQLLWAVADPSTNEQVKPYIDPQIYATMYPARSLLDAGAVIAGASDWPVSTANPFDALYQAETRSGPQGVLNAAQRMPREAMLFAYTRNAAQVLDQLDQIGTLAPGKLADLVLVDRDVLTVPAEELKSAAVLWTMFGGKIVFGTPP